jgi:hypothetical protein
MKAHVLPFFLGAVALATVGGCAAGYSDELKSPEQLALVKATCTNIIGVRTYGEMRGCVSSLSDALAAKTEARIDVMSDSDCAGRGLARGTAEYSVCVLERQRANAAEYARSAPAAANSQAPVKLAYGEKGQADDHSDWTSDARYRREEYACAQLGLDPTDQAFAECVAGLEISLYNADNSST